MDTSSIFGFIVALYASLTTCAVPPSDLPAQQQEQTAIVAEQETQEPAEPEVQPIDVYKRQPYCFGSHCNHTR